MTKLYLCRLGYIVFITKFGHFSNMTFGQRPNLIAIFAKIAQQSVEKFSLTLA